jgi:hypothetical protein
VNNAQYLLSTTFLRAGQRANSAPPKTRGTGKGTLLQSERNQLEPSRQTATHQLDRALLVRLSLSAPHEKRTPARVSPDRRQRTAGEKPLTGNREKPPKSPSSPDSTSAAVQQQPRRPGLKTGTPWRKIPGDVLAPSKVSDRRLVRPTLRGALLGLEIGTSQGTLPVGAGRFRRTPHIVLSGAFLALHASDCSGWPRRWVPGGRRNWCPGRTCRIRILSTYTA